MIEEIIKEEVENGNPKPYCPDCGSENVYGISRVVGYFSVIGNWQISKQAELKRRQKGNYWHEEESKNKKGEENVQKS